MNLFAWLGNFGQSRISSIISDGRFLLTGKLWCTHMAHFLCKEVFPAKAGSLCGLLIASADKFALAGRKFECDGRYRQYC